MDFTLTILGTGSAYPASGKHPSAQVLKAGEELLLFDCGEGTQMQLISQGIKFQRMNHIFISHLHGDHYLGVAGLVFTLHLLGRNRPLHLHAFPELKQIIDLQLLASDTSLVYPLEFHPLNTGGPEIIFENDKFTVSSFPLDHRLKTCGFKVREKPGLRKIRKDFLETEEVPLLERRRIKEGSDFTATGGKFYKNNLITLDPPRPRSYAYCCDTAYDERVIPLITGVDLLFHEATFMEDLKQMAADKHHSTAAEAARIASAAGAGKLILGHFSNRYNDLGPLLEEARQIFPATFLAEEGMTFKPDQR